jgi:Arc/MetJ family transcription regulator
MSKDRHMPVTLTSIRLDTKLADQAAKALGAKSRTEAIHMALREIVAMKKNEGRLRFSALDE